MSSDQIEQDEEEVPSTVWQFSTRKERGEKIIERKINFAGLFLTTYAIIGIHRVIFVMEIRTSSIDECNFRICTAVSVFWLNSMRYCGFCTFFCAVLRLSDPLYAPLAKQQRRSVFSGNSFFFVKMIKDCLYVTSISNKTKC